MKRFKILFLLFIIAPWVQAAETQSAAKTGAPYLLLKTGAMQISSEDSSKFGRIDPLLGVGVLLGYGFNRFFALEADGYYGFYGGEFSPSQSRTGELDYLFLQSFLAFRAPLGESAYLKAKAGGGYARTWIIQSAGTSRESNIVGSGGVGFGVVLDKVYEKRLTLEMDFTQMDSDVIMASVALHVDL